MYEEMTYVFHFKDEHVEVELTGRNATKTLPAAGTAPAREDVLVEIKPVNMEDGRWKKFVRMTELLVISGDS